MRAFSLADNRLAEQSEWDEEVLKLELAALESLDLDFGLELTGFDTVDVDRILGPEPDPTSARPDKEGYSGDPDDQLPEEPFEGSPVSRLNDLWKLGGHLLYNGDATDPCSYQVLMANKKARQIVSDPPYNVPISRHVSSARGFREFRQASGEMSQQESIAFLKRFFAAALTRTAPGALIYVFMD